MRGSAGKAGQPAAFRHALRREHNLRPYPKKAKLHSPAPAEGEFGGILNATNIRGSWRRRKKPL